MSGLLENVLGLIFLEDHKIGSEIELKDGGGRMGQLFSKLQLHLREQLEADARDRPVLKSLLSCCQVLLDMSWEQINVGSWKDVPISVRYYYGYVSYFKALILLMLSEDLLDVLKACDMGLIMAPPFNNNVLAKIAALVHSECVSRNPIEAAAVDGATVEPLVVKLNESRSIQRIKAIELMDFEKAYFNTNTPVVIENAIDLWPSVNRQSDRKWSLQFILQQAGYRTVPIEVGSKYTDVNWSQKLMTIKEFVDSHMLGNQIGYLAQHELFNQIEELSSDFSIPEYCSLSRDEDAEVSCDVDINAWFGPKGTVSPLHFDSKDNLLSQVFGSKYIRLYSSETPTEFIYPCKCGLLTNTSEVDLENVDTQRFPLFSEAEYQECVLSEGEMLYIPPKFWHFVKSLTPSFSISFWWK